MSIKQFELFHGAVLTKLLRNDKPVTLRLVERTARDPWAAYRVNDACCVYIKYRTTFRLDAYSGETAIYDFLFTKTELSAIRSMPENLPVYFALVCASDKTDAKYMQVCFIEPDEFSQFAGSTTLSSLTISVWSQDGKGMRAKSKATEKPLIIPRSRLDNWEAPGA